MVDVSRDRFEDLVGEALDSIPEGLGRLMDNVAVLVRDGDPDGDLLGHYDGIPLTERSEGYDGMVMPDRITIPKNPVTTPGGSSHRTRTPVPTTTAARSAAAGCAKNHQCGWRSRAISSPSLSSLRLKGTTEA